MLSYPGWALTEDTLDDGSSAYSTDTMMPQLYDELKRLASYKVGPERTSRVLSGTSLLHEAYIRLSKEGSGAKWVNDRQFYSAAAEAMRRVLIDRIRAKWRLKRGADFQRVTYADYLIDEEENSNRLLEVNDALVELEKVDVESAELVKFRYFVGMTLEEIAELSDVSVSTLKRRWAYARSWLARFLSAEG